MKVIFLDNDGVICLANNWGSRFKKQNRSRYATVADNNLSVFERFDDFDKKAIKVLNSILEETDAEIVVSSDWQNFANCEELGEYYESQGIIKKPIGVTKEIDGIDFKKYDKMPWNRDLDLEQHRSLEILEWLEAHPEVTNWVAIDDLDMSARYGEISGNLSWGLTNFVHTPFSRQGIKQSGVKDKVLKFLRESDVNIDSKMYYNINPNPWDIGNILRLDLGQQAPIVAQVIDLIGDDIVHLKNIQTNQEFRLRKKEIEQLHT